MWNRWRTTWVRVEYFPRTYNIADSRRDAEHNGSSSNKSRRLWRSNHLHLYVHRHRLDQEGFVFLECFSNSEKAKDFAKRFPLGHWSFFDPGEKVKWYGTHNDKLEGQWNTVADVIVANFKDSGHPVFRASSSLDRGFLKKKGRRCTMHFSAAIISKYGEIRCEGEWAVMSKIGDWGRQYVGTNTWDECSSSEGSTAWSPREIRTSVERDKSVSDLWISWVHEESVYWTILPNRSRCGRCIWRKDRVTQRVFITSWSSRFWTYWVDQWAHQNRSSSSGQNHMLSSSMWNWGTGTVNIKRRI